MKKSGKKGASHVEFVLSFVIFVVFLIFMYSALDPIVKSAGSKQFVLGHLKLAMVENLTLSDFTIQTFTLDLTNTQIEDGDCVKLTASDGGTLYDLANQGDQNLIIKRISGEIINYSFSGGGMGGGVFGIGPFYAGDENILKIYFASEFVNRSPELDTPSGAPGSCKGVDKDDYNIESIEEREIIASTNVFDIKRWYEDNYDELSYSLGVPSGSDWNFEFRIIEFIDAEGGEETIIEPLNAKRPPENTNIYVGEFPIQYIDEEATTKIGFIRITVW